MRQFSDFFFGLSVPLKAARLILGHKSLLLLSLLPVLLTLGVYLLLFAYFEDRWLTAFDAWAAGHWNPNAWYASLVRLVSKLGLILISFFTFSLVAGFVAVPINDFLAERAELYTHPAINLTQVISLRQRLRLLGIDAIKALVTFALVLALLLCSWIPLLNVIAWTITPLLIAFQYLSYPQTRRSLGIKESVVSLWRDRLACFGFGIAYSFLFAIPLFSCLVLPLAVVGGTILFARGKSSRPI